MNMKLLLTSIFLFAMCGIYGQESINYFYVDGNEIYWQKVIETTLDSKQITDKIIESGALENPKIEENMISGNLFLFQPDYKAAGFTRMNIPIYLSTYLFYGNLIIEIKDGRYRVTIKNIMAKEKYEPNTETRIETWGLKRSNNEFTQNFVNITSKILNHTFTNKFTVNEVENEW